MKTAMIARFVLGASAIFAAAGLVGCGAETGSGEPGAIGSTSEALATNKNSMTTGREAPASCTITGYVLDGMGNHVARDFLLVAGGRITGTPTYTNTAELFDPVANTWASASSFGTLGSGSAGDERAYAKMLQIPGHSDKCLLAAGLNTGGLLATTFRATIVGTTVTWAADTSLHQSRAKFALAACAGSKIIAIGGGDGATRRNTIETFTYNATPGSSTWTDSGVGKRLADSAYDFAFSPNNVDPLKKFLVVSGNGASNAYSLQVSAIVTDTSCAVSSVTDLTTVTGHTFNLSEPRTRAVMFPTSTNDQFLLVAGEKTGPALVTKDETISVDWTNLQGSATNAATAITAVKSPVLVNYNSGSKYYLVGGESGGAGVTNVQKYTVAGGGWASDTLNTARYENVAEYLNSKVYTTAGKSFLTSTEEIP